MKIYYAINSDGTRYIYAESGKKPLISFDEAIEDEFNESERPITINILEGL